MFYKKFLMTLRNLLSAGRRLDEIKLNQGLLLSQLNYDKPFRNLADYEFKVFSQWGEDGILQFLTSRVEIKNKTFIEFGVEDFHESNCRFLMIKDLWRGFVIDGSRENIQRLKSADFYWRCDLNAIDAFITKENVCSLLEQSKFDKDLGILSVDIDGVDYYVLNELTEWRPRIIIVEYNAVFGHAAKVSVPYTADFQRGRQHYSNLYYGASLGAFAHLLGPRGYALVGVNVVGSNAFFVRRDLLNEFVQEVSIEQAYRPSIFREGRDSAGNLSFKQGNDKRGVISDMPLIDVETGASMKVADL